MRSLRWQWLILLGLSALLMAGLEAVRLPAALMIGPMLAAILLVAGGGTLKLPQGFLLAAQGVVGCLIAQAIPAAFLGEVRGHWPVFLAAILWVIVASSFLGWFLARCRVLPGSTAVWGSSPGAATAMVFLAEAYGADERLVAFMQYFRVVLVSSSASVLARVWTGAHSAHAQPAMVWFPPLAAKAFPPTLLLITVGVLLARRFRIPAGPLLLPMVLGLLCQDTGLFILQLPPWLLALSYTLVGWGIGLRFSRAMLRHALGVLPRMTISTLALIAVCAVFGVVLSHVTGIDPLTAYLATSPGGADSMAIIASSTRVDMPFVMAMQASRFITVLITGPYIARFLARHIIPTGQ
ncbi:putative ammonia monooxygenase [mine drainage metagenome]|uniref:Putative ammonia monooxygenase n=1 Tax=mine drainage metagenome TaxID=410659 RepID=A0A1J5TA51_9ZZZZ